jgi:hypothetical protein
MLILFPTNTEDLQKLLLILVSIMSLFNSTVLYHEEMWLVACLKLLRQHSGFESMDSNLQALINWATKA